MSQADVERFVADLKSNDELRDEVTGAAGGIGSIVEVAKDKGYDITVEEARDYIRSQASSELSDEQLDQVAGGKGGADHGKVAVHGHAGAGVAAGCRQGLVDVRRALAAE